MAKVGWVLIALIFQFFFADAAVSADSSAWEKAYDPATKTRFIPIELWTGSTWDGSLELKMTKADLVFGKKSQKRLTGPITWTRPGTKEQLQVYERTNRDKRQLFALTSRKDGLGRVYDSRYARDCVDEVKFPLGCWKQGERRIFDVSCNSGTLKRRIELTIEEIDFTYHGASHSLRYRWIVDGGKGHDTDMVYIYSPGLGLVSASPASNTGPSREIDE